MARERDHRGIVGAELRPRIVQARARLRRPARQLLAQPAVRAHAAGDHQRADAGHRERAQALADQRFHHRILEAARGVGARLIVEVAAAQGDDHRGLDAAEAEVEAGPVEHRAREIEYARAPGLGQRGERRSPGIAEAQELGGLVEGLSRCIVQRLAEHPVSADTRDFDQHGVPARDLQRNIRKFRGIRLKRRRQQVAFEVVHADHRHAQRVTERARHAGPHQQCPDQAGSRRIGNPVNGLQREPGPGQGLLDHRQQARDVVARGEFRHHAAMRGMNGHLAENPVRDQAPVAVVDGHRGLVAGGFDAEDYHGPITLIFRGRITTIPGPFPGAVPGAQCQKRGWNAERPYPRERVFRRCLASFQACLRKGGRADRTAPPGILREAHPGTETQEGRRHQAAPEARLPRRRAQRHPLIPG